MMLLFSHFLLDFFCFCKKPKTFVHNMLKTHQLPSKSRNSLRSQKLMTPSVHHCSSLMSTGTLEPARPLSSPGNPVAFRETTICQADSQLSGMGESGLVNVCHICFFRWGSHCQPCRTWSTFCLQMYFTLALGPSASGITLFVCSA